MTRDKHVGDTPQTVGRFSIKKYASQEDYDNDQPYQDGQVGDNLLLNVGINELFTLMCSGGGTRFDNANARLGVGDDSTAADASQNGLLSTNAVFKAMNDGFPTYGTDQKATFEATFQGSEANFDWREFALDNGSVVFDRLVEDQGTKADGQVWALTLEISLA